MNRALAVFPYKKHQGGITFPIIPLRVTYKIKRVEIYALIDSGATVSIFRPEVAEQLGLAIEAGEPTFLSGVGGRIKGYLHQLKVETLEKNLLALLFFRMNIRFP